MSRPTPSITRPAIISAAAAICILWSGTSMADSLQPSPSSHASGRLTRTLPSRGATEQGAILPADLRDATSRRATGIDLFDQESKYKPIIFGMMQYSDAWYNLPEGATYPYGCYAYSPKWASPVSVLEHPNLIANGGGCYTDHAIHYRMYEMNAESNTFRNFYMVVDTDNWTFVQDYILTNVDNTIANDMTYDPISDNIYAAVWGNFDGGATRLAIVDKVTGECSEIATLPDLVCLASDNFGVLYGVENTTGILYQIDKTTGRYVRIGSTGLTPKYAQSACVDPETNVIYWTACLADGTSGVYTIDTSTGKATLKTALTDNPEFTCTFIEAPTKGLDAPAAVTNLVAENDGAGVTVSFTLPTKGFDGSAPGALTAHLYIDGTEVYNAPADAGATLRVPTSLESGQHSIVAFASNAVGEGAKQAITHFTGADLPAAPQNVRLSVTDLTATLTWDAPERGLNGGTIDASAITYSIVRHPGAVEVVSLQKGTTFTEMLPNEIANYYYTVTSSSDKGVGGSANSNSYYAGEVYTPTCEWTFDTADDLKGFTILGLDNDEYSWAYSDFNKAVWSRFNKTEQQNDWLITPPIQFEGNATYRLSFKARVFDKDNPERFEVKAGAAPSEEGMTISVVPGTVTNNEKYDTYTGTVTPTTDGILYFGFHAMSPANSYRLIIDDIRVEKEANGIATLDLNSATHFDIYTLSGLLLHRNADRSHLLTLPRGLYIIRTHDGVAKLRL